MFIDLLHLYKKQKDSGKTPLEDFNTEAFANILKMYKDIKEDFLYNFLILPQDNYVIETQLKRELIDDQNCIIDLTFIGNENVCFIENKIESCEGYKQLERYSKVLDEFFSTRKQYLCYCTKYSDPKNDDKKFDIYNFKQFKWYEIAKFLKKYRADNPLINEYLNFLNQYNMEQDNIFRVENLITMENMIKTIEIIEFHIGHSIPKFNHFFGRVKPGKWNTNRNFIEYNRKGYYIQDILFSQNGSYSEILFSIELDTLKLNTHIYTDSKFENYNNFISLKNNEFLFEEFDYGSLLYLEEDLGKFLNNENSDELIKNWFENSFSKMKELMNQNTNKKLKWNI